MQESKEPIEFTEASQPDDELDVQEEVRTSELKVSIPLPVALSHAVGEWPSAGTCSIHPYPLCIRNVRAKWRKPHFS